MANFKMDGLDDVMKQLEALGSGVEEIAIKAVDAATPSLVSSMQSNIRTSAGHGYATGALEGSVKANEAKINNYGVMAAVTIKGTDSKGMRNGEKAAYLEYGTGHQPAYPFMAKSVREAESSCRSAMEEVFGQGVDSLT